MSKIGKQPLVIPKEVEIKQTEGNVMVRGPKGELALSLRPEISLKMEEHDGNPKLLVLRKNDSKMAKSLHGLTRSLIANMIEGVCNGFGKTLKIIGTGYRAKMEGKDLVLTVGFSHPVKISANTGIEFEVKGSNVINIRGIDRQLVGQVAADIRKVRPPDAYKGKGIRYKDEVVRKKAGKAAKIGSAA